LVTEGDRWLVKEIVKSSKEPVKCRVIPPGNQTKIVKNLISFNFVT